jgi:xanthine dehydrogenase YagT iron-sulfur-binding subunit
MAKRPNHDDRSPGVTRRGFIGTVGAGAVAVAATGVAATTAEAHAEITTDDMTQVALTINDRVHRMLVEPRWTLLYVLRERLGLTATKVGCERGECGACTVLINGQPRYACMTLVLEAEGAEITTLEGLMDGEELGDVQQAFLEEDAFQCGYCTPGQVVAAEGLLRANPKPNLEQIRHGMAGNLCRCAAYVHIFRAVDRAAGMRAAEMKKGGGK